MTNDMNRDNELDAILSPLTSVRPKKSEVDLWKVALSKERNDFEEKVSSKRRYLELLAACFVGALLASFMTLQINKLHSDKEEQFYRPATIERIYNKSY